ncbi:MAG: hypothetical protein HN905_03225 [Candidatus Marinimicrobia bacterium]|jgi:hypothetical protein|nr:hypothetical protein [Candidatus Neomarinimicrobiota bacterium]
MAINVNTVYRTVLSLTNREQRGFMTPDQYNRLARMAQLDLFEKAFFDYNRYLTRNKTGSINDEYANLAKAIKEKIDVFSTSSTLTFSSGIAAVPSNFYKCIMISTSTRGLEVQEIQKSDLPQINSSKLTAPTTSYPIYYKQGANINIFPTTISSATLDYIFKPTDPTWAFTTGATYGDMAYASGSSINFQLHDSEEVPLVIKILAYSGIILKDPNIIQVAKQEEVQKINQENT